MNDSQKLQYAELELQKAKAENARLRKSLHENGKHARRIDKAYQDALLLSTFYVGGIIPSRRFAKIQGLSQNRWENSIALLKLARVVEGHRRWVAQGLDVIEKKLIIAKGKSLEDPRIFFLRANSHCRRGHD